MARIDFFSTTRCPLCPAARQAVLDFARTHEGIDVCEWDLERHPGPALGRGIFVTPSLLVNGTHIFYGVPSAERLAQLIANTPRRGGGFSMQRQIERLIFVFHADSGPLAAVLDSAKKLLLMKGCALCDITHGVAGERREWKLCKETLAVPIDYLHLDEIPSVLRDVVAGRTPCVLARVGQEHVVLLGPTELDRCRGSVTDFRGRLLYHAFAKGLDLPLDPGSALATASA